MHLLKRYAPILLLVFICVVSRLPQLLSTQLLADGDECVIGLMSKHLIEGKEFPVFFHGQSYGFSLVECLPVALSFLVFGINDLGLKLPMLIMFIMAMVFFYHSLLAIAPKYKLLAFFITLAFIFSPSWALWSMKARGGYLTAILLSHILIWLVYSRSELKNRWHWSLVGVILVIIYQSQPLWLPGLLPLIFYKLYPQANRREWVAFLIGIVPVLAIFILLKLFSLHQWQPHVFTVDPHVVWVNIIHLPVLLMHYFNGYYYLYYIYHAPLVNDIAAIVAIMIVAVLLLAGVIMFVKDHQRYSLFVISVFAIFATIGYCIFLKEHTPRYLLPLTGFMLLSLFIFLQQNLSNIKTIIVVVFLILTGVPSLYQFKDYTFFPAKRAEVIACVNYLTRNKVQYAFSNDGLLQWQIMFYSKEKIICRESDSVDRYPEYIAAVTKAYYQHDAHLAIIDNTTDLLSIEPDKTVKVISHFYVLIHPDASVMHDMEFKL